MCGIAGFSPASPTAPERGAARAQRMADTMRHRGPDDSGTWASPEGEAVLAHRRLAILDLSPAGHQPMLSADERYAVVYNGEIYNHLTLRVDLARRGHTFTGTSDTETLLAALREYGITATIPRLRGMFAMALWDRKTRCIHLVRDRLGIKPLYYGTCGGTFLFGSELKALRAHPDWNAGIDPAALTAYLRRGYIPAPLSIHKDVHKLPPGTILTFDTAARTTTQERYWDVHDIWRRGAQEPFAGTAGEAADELERLLTEAVACRLLSDVPLGAFLSGGVDSSLVTALMCAASPGQVRTFSIGFTDPAYDEAPHAAAVARHLGTRHTAFTLTPQDLLDVVPDIPRHFDEPFGDASQIPMLILSRLAREHVTVALSGDGGDELFSGYTRYALTQGAWQRLRRIPAPVRHLAARMGPRLPAALYRRSTRRVRAILWRLDALAAPSFAALYDRLSAHHPEPENLIPGASPPSPPLLNGDDTWRSMSLTDLSCYLPGDILTKVDRATMAASLEARVPLLDHHVVEFASRLPSRIQRKDGPKTLLRWILGRHIPPVLVERPKAGFTVPVEHWLHSDLREWCGDMLSAETTRACGLLDPRGVAAVRDAYFAGVSPWHSCVWDILMLHAWHEHTHSRS